MSSSSDLSSPGGGDDSSRATYCAAPQLIWRTVLQGVVVRRWDQEGETVMLNPSAWMVMDTLVSGASPMTLDAIIRAIESHATFDISAVGDLRHVLDELVGRELVIGVD